MNPMIQTIKEDCEILLTRALKGKTVSFFGEDGNGAYGSDYYAHHAVVQDVTVYLKNDVDSIRDVDAAAMIFLSGYSSKRNGHAATDANLRISLNRHLKAEEIDATCLGWAPEAEQGDTCVVMKIDVDKLMGW
jgi:hypothetical protein